MKNLLACYANCRYNTRCDELRKEIENKTDQAALDINAYLTERGKGAIAIQYPKRGLKFVEANQKKIEIKKPALKSPAPVKEARQLASISKSTSPRLELRAAPIATSKGVAKKSAKETKKMPVTRRKKRRPALASSMREEKRVAAVQPTPAVRQKEKKRVSRKPRKANPVNKEIAPEIMAMNNKANGNAEAYEQTQSTKAIRARKPKKNGAGSKSRKGKVYIIIEGKTANIVNEKGLMTHLFNNSSAGTRYFEATEVEARVQIVAKH